MKQAGVKLAVWIVALWLVAMLPVTATAQALYGSVVGNVTDESGAAIPGATVSLRNVDTNLELAGSSNESGTFTISNVLPGSYELRVALSGFSTFAQTGLAVTAGSVARVDARLTVNALAESVTVASRAAVLQTDKADTRVELKSKEVTSLPLSPYRNFQSLLALVPGATPPAGANQNDTPSKGLRSVVNGTNFNNNGTRLDGQVNMNLWLTHQMTYVPPADTIDTVGISTTNFDADQGMAAGAAVTVVTKSGTNQLRGTANGSFGDEALNARPYFSPDKSDMSRHILGGTLGGPILRDRLFFFGSWEGMFERLGQFNYYNVPTERMREGDFSEVATQRIYDPATGSPDGAGRTPFDGNVIPRDRLSAAALRVQEFYPRPNLPGLSRNYVEEATSKIDRNNYDLKLNWARSSSHQIWGKVSVMKAITQNLQRFAWPGQGRGDTDSLLLTAGHTWTLTPRTVVDGTIGLTRYTQDFETPDFGTNYGSDVLGLPGTNGPDARQSGFPWFSTGFSTLGESRSWYPANRNDGSFSAASNLTTVRGNHEIRFGGELARHHLRHWQAETGAGPRGGFTFGGGVTALRGGSQSANLYNSYAAFLLGLPTTVGKTLQYEEMTTREWQFALYVRDRWQVNQRLTVSAGLRWERYPIMRRADRGLEVLDPETMDVLLGGRGGNPDTFDLKASWTLFAPRAGLAWRLGEETVFRAGYGITYNPTPWTRGLRGFYPLTIAQDFTSASTFVPVGRLEDGIPPIPLPDLETGRVALPVTAFMRTPNPDIGRGHIHSWNVTLERRLPLDLAVSTAYVGTRTVDGYALRDLNAGVAGLGAAGQPYYARFGRTASTEYFDSFTRANYHSLQVAVNRPFKCGLLLKGAYTWSKAMNQTDEDGWAEMMWDDPSQFARNYARAGFDRTHILQMGFVYELPFARDRGGVLSAIVRDWQVNGIFAAYSGTPFTVTTSGASLNAPGNTQTADQLGEAARPGGVGPGSPYYDPSAWAAVTAPRYGSSGRNSVRGPGLWTLDFSLFRGFALGASRLELRAEALNLTNTPQFSNPNSNVTGANFMTITGTNAGSERNIRLGVRFAF